MVKKQSTTSSPPPAPQSPTSKPQPDKEEIPEDEQRLELKPEDTDGGIWTPETEALFFFAADKFPPTGVTYPMQSFNIRMCCGKCVPVKDPSGACVSHRLFTAEECLRHVEHYWHTRVEPDATTAKEAAEKGQEHHLPHYVLPREFRRVRSVEAPLPPPPPPSKRLEKGLGAPPAKRKK